MNSMPAAARPSTIGRRTVVDQQRPAHGPCAKARLANALKAFLHKLEVQPGDDEADTLALDMSAPLGR